MKTVITTLAICLLLTFSLSSYASSAAKPTAKPANQNNYCPTVNKLTKQGMRWDGPGGWKSYSDSFVKQTKYFIGAQWIGINVGKIICLYRGDDSLTFPVALERNDVLIKAPKIDKTHYWTQDRGGYMECRSADIKKCPFKILAPPPKKDIYEDLDFYKKK